MTMLQKYNLVVTLPYRVHIHNIEIATQWLLSVYLVDTEVATTTIHRYNWYQNTKCLLHK